MRKTIFTFIMVLFSFLNSYSQNLNLDEYEIYINDTLIAKSDFIKNGQNLSEEKAKSLVFKPISNGDKKAFFLNGNIYSIGKIKNLKENGFWEYFHFNGNKAREGEFIDGKPNGTHKYWYENGNLRAIGNWVDGLYDGKWEMYSEDGKETIIQIYKNGKKVD
ncbi:hypothetical protein NU10_02125 [Flavobacterium dauae]|uniref:toxin-antitoxin system YwqK family antitoxin n=1 Tax=Flavobacterium dauae TaxID=1563479 RepID=UPI00101BB082|nr:hypothetical protein [Flavobacterium dauae]WLD24219.1 hypothetical protein NU10_02125 [Flavobacterium dauae]